MRVFPKKKQEAKRNVVLFQHISIDAFFEGICWIIQKDISNCLLHIFYYIVFFSFLLLFSELSAFPLWHNACLFYQSGFIILHFNLINFNLS